MDIKHLVFSGGGHVMINNLGTICKLVKSGKLDLNKIESIYGTSAGGILGVFIALKIDLDIITNYVINRPWSFLFSIDTSKILSFFINRGIYGTDTIEQCFKSLFYSKGLSLNITMLEFYEFSNIELNLYSVELNTYSLIEINYKSYPNLTLINAIQMSCAIPIIISPIIIDNKCFIDGGFICNYPLKYCVLAHETELDNILGFKNKYIKEGTVEKEESKMLIGNESNLFDYIVTLLCKILCNIGTNDNLIIPHEIITSIKHMDYNTIVSTVSSSAYRQELFDT